MGTWLGVEILCELSSFSDMLLDYANNIHRSQLVYRLNENTFLRLPDNANTVYNRFNYEYNNTPQPYNRQLSPVSYAIFQQAYRHTAINGINYATGPRELPMIYRPLFDGIQC
jgi:hypothetical protein